MPRLLQSIRFRLSLAIAVVVFSVGSFMIGGIYLRQLNSLETPVLRETPVVVFDEESGEFVGTDLTVATDGDVLALALEQERDFAYRQALAELRSNSYYALGALFFVSFGAGWLLSGWVLRPIKRITAVARDISATDLSRRIALRGPDDELSQLANTFDQMLDRIEKAFDDQRRFIHETSHELRNPLAIVRANLELGLTSDDPDEISRVTGAAKTATDRMSVLIDDLLENARQQVTEPVRHPFDVGLLLSEIGNDFAPAAAEREIVVETPESSQALMIDGDMGALRRAIANLIVNAIRLAPVGSTLRLVGEREGDRIMIRVADEGPGISDEHQERVFDRYWRGPRSGGGSGLGLSIVRNIARRHGGDATVCANTDGGSTFTIELPGPENL